MQQQVGFINSRTTQPHHQQLYFAFCGYSVTLPGHSHGPAIRTDYVIHIVLEGEGSYLADNQRMKITANQGFIIEPGNSTFYQSASKNPWKYLWMAFNGELAAEYLRKSGLLDGRLVFQVEDTSYFLSIIKRCFQHQSQVLADELMLTGLVFEFLAGITKSTAPLINSAVESVNHHIPRILDYLKKNFRKQLSIQEMSTDLYLERSYLSRLFRESMDMGIKEYLNQLRVIYAADILTTTNLTIERITYMSGFKNEDVFIRAFKKYWDTTPLQYRKAAIDKKISFKKEQGLEDFVAHVPVRE